MQAIMQIYRYKIVDLRRVGWKVEDLRLVRQICVKIYCLRFGFKEWSTVATLTLTFNLIFLQRTFAPNVIATACDLLLLLELVST